MRFEQGKYYRHANGTEIHVCGTAKTVFRGTGLVAEGLHGNNGLRLVLVGGDEDCAEGYVEVRPWVMDSRTQCVASGGPL